MANNDRHDTMEKPLELIEVMADLDLSAADLASRTKLSEKTIRRAMNGEPVFTMTAAKIARALGRKVSAINFSIART